MRRSIGCGFAPLLAFFVLALVLPARAQPVATPRVSAGGIAFRHVLMPEDTHQSLAFAWKDGTSLTRAGKEALGALATELMLEGPRGLTRSAMIEDIRDLQASMSLGAGTNYTQGQLSAPRAKFSGAADMLARVLADPALPDERLKNAQRNRVLASEQQAQNAESLASLALARHLLGDAPYWRILGAVPSIYEQITKADVETWRRDVLVRDGLMLVAAGPMTAEEVGREIDRIFGGLPQSGHVEPVPKPVFRASGKLIVIERPVVQTAIVAAGATTLAITSDYIRAEMAIQVLGRAFTGRLFRAVREKLGAAYGISATLRPLGTESRALYISSAVANDKSKAALAAIREEYARFVADGALDDEIEPLKTVFITGAAERLRRSASVAGSFLAALQQGYPDDYFATYDSRVRGYGVDGVNEVIRTNFPAPPLTFVVVTPSAEGLDADCVIKGLADIARCD